MVDCLYHDGLLLPNLWKEQSTEEELSAVREMVDKREDLHQVKWEFHWEFHS